MYVSQISPAIYSNMQLLQPRSKTNNLTNKNENLSKTGFVQGYYLPFKANVVSKHLRNFETLIDNFYSKYNGCNVKNLSTTFISYCDQQTLSYSRLLNHKFKIMGDGVLNSTPEPSVTETLLVEATSSGLKNIKHRLNSRLKQFSYDVNFPVGANAIINNLKKEGYLPQEISFNNKEQGGNIRKIIADSLFKNLDLPEPVIDVLEHDFITGYADSLKNNNAVLDESVKKSLKEILQDKDFIQYSQKMDLIESRDKILGLNHLDKTIEALYEDLVKNNLSPFENPKYYDYLSQNEEKLDLLLEKLLGFHISRIENKFNCSQIAPKHKVLLANPLFIDKLDDLIKYVESQNIKTEKLSPIELQKKFSDYLGSITVFCELRSKDPANLVKNLYQDGHYNSNLTKEALLQKLKYYLEPSTEMSTIRSNIDMRHKYAENEYIPASLSKDGFNTNISELIYGNKSIIIKTTVPRLNLIKYGSNNLSNSELNFRVNPELLEKMYLPFTFSLKDFEIISM